MAEIWSKTPLWSKHFQLHQYKYHYVKLNDILINYGSRKYEVFSLLLLGTVYGGLNVTQNQLHKKIKSLKKQSDGYI